MNCVNIKSRDFIQLARRLNLSSNTLELIIHKYRAETGFDTAFPSDVYIQAQLGKDQYIEPSKAVRDLWETSYSTPQSFNSLQEYQRKYEEAKNYFPNEALVHYKDNENKDVLAVKKPVKELRPTINDYLDSDLHTKQEWDDYDLITRQLAANLKNNNNFAVADKIREQYGTDRKTEEDKYLPEILGQHGEGKAANKTLATATRLTRGIPRNDGQQRGFSKEKFLAHLEVTAIQDGTWIDDVKTITSQKNNKHGGESEIYLSKDGKSFIKLNRFALLDEEHGIEEFIDRINSHNEFAGNAPYSVLGFAEDSEGNVCIIMQQPVIKGSEAPQKEIDGFLTEAGFKKKILSDGTSGWTNGVYEIWDADSSNVLKDNNGNFYFIDAVINNIDRVSRFKQIAEEDNTTFSHFDLEKPIKLQEKGIAADLRAIQANEWHLPEDTQKTVADRLQKYMDDKSGEIQEVDTVPYFGEKGKTNAKDILTYITKNSTDKDIRTLASFVLKNLGKNGTVPVSFSNNTRGSRGKYYTNSHSVRISKASMTGNDVASATNNMEQTIIHEIAHAISVRAIETSPETRKELLQIFKDYKQLENQYGINTGYAAKNPKEFLAEFLGRKAFREALIALPSIRQENKKTKQTIGQRVLNWLKNVLHIGNKSSFFKRADEVIQKVLDQANSQEFFYTDEMETAAEDRNPQSFTFNDGTVITAPFTPNRQQADALNAMNDFLNSNETTMTLSGYAGTGKTSLMEIIAQKARRQHKPIMFSATTNKAAAVLKSRVSKAGFDAQTLNKVFGINVEVDSSKAYNARNLVTALKEANVTPGTTVVIDEASMINEENYSILNRVARENSLKIIYVGDKAQLAPVNENQVSKVFRNSEGRVVELTQVERTDDNAILKEATNIRNGLPLSGESSFNERGEGVGYLTPKSREEVSKVIRHYIQGLKDNPNFFRILAYTNKAVTSYNDFVRSLLGYTNQIPHIGEPLTGYNNWGYEWRTKSYRFINSESYKATEVGSPQISSISINGENFTMQYVPVTMENSLGESDTFNYIDIRGNQENRKAALQLANQKKTLWEQYRRAVGREAKSNILSQINSIDQFLFVNDNLEDPTTHNLLQPKTVDFSYALTIHKSQGSTFTHVLMDDIDVAKASNPQSNATNAMTMVDLGDAGQIADATMEVRSSEDVDLGDLSSVPADPVSSTNPNVANVRQQLEYVGVSRATNTVTIVSNNVKKESSPLNYIKDDNTTNSEESRSNKEVEVTKEEVKQNELLPIKKEVKESSQKVSLPGYEYFMGKYEDTTVDAAWKIPMLETLDKQLSTELTPEENNEILDRMTRILEAKSQEDLLDLLSDEPKTNKKVEQNLTEFEKMTQQINNLLDSNIISASEIRHVAELVINSISDTITILQKEEGAAEKFFPNIQTDLDFKGASRKEIVEAIGINNLIHRAKQQFDPEQNDYEDFDTMEQADLIIDNWDAIMTLAADTFAMTEGFGIMRNYDKGGFATTQNSTVDFDNFNDYSNDPDAMAESEKDEQEHWQVEQRTIDILNSMSQMVRLALHECYQMDKEGNKVMSKWGIAERINTRKAVNSILRWTQGSLTLEDMIGKMQGKATQNPWLNQLIERLSDKSGKETDFQSQFFGVFSKHFQPYSVVLLEDGKYHSIPVNGHPALSEAMQTITTQFKIGEHPLFTDGGINRKLLGTEQTIYPEAPFNLHKALTSLRTIQDRINHGEQLDNAMSKEAAANIMGVCRVMGYPVTEEMLSDVINEENLSKMTKSLGFIVGSLDATREEQFRNAGTPNAKVYNPFAFKSDNGIAGTLRNFLTPITDTLEDTAVSAFYDSGKMYQSYVTPSFMTKLMNKFRLEGQEFEDFIMQEYGATEWFKSAKNQLDVNKGWRNEWLRLLATDENARKVFNHKVELNFNKHNYMRNMSDAEYTLSLITEYFAETGQKKEALVPAWFRVPIMSNKPSSEFIKFYSYRDANYKSEIIYGLHQMFNQELSRIQTVSMRNHSKGDADFIANFDTNGRKFNFLPFLNQFLEKSNTSELAKLLQKKVNGSEVLTAEEEARLSTLVDQAIRQDMENRVATILNQWENSGIIEAAKNIEGIGTEDAQIRANLENFLWNDNFASKNILQLTVTDIAFYKDAEDLQKRLAQIHAPGIRGNVTATDYGNPEKGIPAQRVSDGKYRTVLIQGLQKFKTDLIANIAEVFNRKIAAAPEGQKAQLRALKESLVGENGRYTKIDVTDGQAYSSPSSYRKKAFIFGKWSRQAEDIYQKLLKNDYNYSDLEVAFQPLKPFVYTHLQKDMGVDNAPIHQIPVPFQAKNSEYLLIMADALIKGEEAKSGKLSRPNILGAIYRIMEDSERLNPTKGIDTIQFDSAIKSGLQAPIDLNPFLDMEGGEEAAYEYMKRMIYKLDDQGNPSNKYVADTYVHEGLYEDYCLQQEVPEHFKNHSQAHGSQIRMIIPSDLDFYKNPNADHNDPNNQVFYEWTESDGTKKKVRADEFRREYEQTIAANIRESIDQLSQELYINSENKRERNIALSKILQREILSSPRYGIDLIQACSIDKETGEFRIPKGDPIQAKRIEQLINSIIKNRVNKQKIAGGPIVQVTNFGTSRQLHIRFNSKDGGLLMTREEYEKNPQKKEMSQTDKFNARYGRKTASGNMTYEEYVKQNQAGIAYFEVFIPMWANEIFEKFSNEDGTINMEALEATDPELLKMISYRIPTEDKYSCAPMKAVGFMPREAGDAIMFPYELTEIDDSDFDVDKRYVMRKDIPIVRKPKHIIRKELFNIVEESYKKQHNDKELPANIVSEIEVFLDSPDTMRSKSTFTKWLYSQYQKIAYTTEAPTSGRKYRDNKIVDMTWAVLTNEMTADKILNPGGFDVFKRAGYMVAAYKNQANNYSWEQLQQMSIDELNKLSYTDKDLTWLDTQIQFYKQNAAAASLIGVFAVNKVAHATLESNNYYVAVDEICGNEPFTIADTEFGSRMKVDPSHDSEGNLIGKTIGAGVSASADAAKTPVLNLMNINMTTAGIFNTLLRLGMAPNDASLFMSQEVIERVLNEFNRENLTNYTPLSTIIEEHISNLRDKYSIDDNSNINTEPLSKEELIDGLTPVTPTNEQQREVIDYKVLLAFQKIRSLVDAMRKPTFATRFNSISSAVGPLIIDNLIMEHKMEQFTDAASEDGTHFYDSNGYNIDIDDIFYDHPILKEFSRTVDIAKAMFSDMPAGSTGFRNLLATLPEGLTDKVYNDKKLLDNLSNFYQSYLLIASRMVNPANLKSYIDGFPKYFNDQKFKEQYPDNPLIQAIRMNVSKRTGRPFLSINITGIDESQKEVYRSAWIDLHKDNPELSKQLFEYCFFRAGVGFSPKTFMSLVPTYVKERLSKDLGNGSQATYVNTYRRFPSVNPNVVIDQWVRNNWDNNKLVPKKGGEGTHYIVDLKRGTLVARDPKDMADLQEYTYIKTRHNGQTYLWKQIIADKTAVNYVMVKPLGNNAEYLEMSLSDITKPMSETKETIEDMQESELQTVSPAEAEAAETSTVDNTTDSEKVKQVAELADLIQKQNPKLNKTQALNQIERMKEKPDLYAGFLVNVYKQKGLNLTKEEALAEFKKLC